MLRLATCILLVLFIHQTSQQGKSVDDLITELFPKKPEAKNPGTTTSTMSTLPVIEGTDQCECVPYYLCNNDSVINTNGMGLIDIRADEGSCESYLDLCCKHSDVRPNPIIPKPEIKEAGCGRRNIDGVGFRTTGDIENEAKFGEFPWMVAILHDETMTGTNQVLTKYQCGGALIHPQAVVTAAHCVATKKNYRVRAGEWDTQTEKEIFPYQDRFVKTTILHPQYYAGALFNDIAVQILESPFKLAENIDVLCLPPQGTVVPSGTRCFASGWGKDVFGKEGKYQVILKKIELPIVEKNTCQNNLRQTRLGRHFNLHESFVCAGGEPGIDTCKGDGGSPLVCLIPGQQDRYQHVGIVAWGIGCGENQIPGVYANVAMFRDWINEQMAYNNLGTTTYEY